MDQMFHIVAKILSQREIKSVEIVGNVYIMHEIEFAK